MKDGRVGIKAAEALSYMLHPVFHHSDPRS